MAYYGLRYGIEFMGMNNTINEISIYERDYYGSTVSLTGSRIPLSVSLKNESDNFDDNIVAQTYYLGLDSDENLKYINFSVWDSQKYKVEIRINSSLNNVIYGWLMPETYTEPYVSKYYQTIIGVTDGLLTLDKVDFKNGDDYYTGIKSLMHVLFLCLNKTNLGLGIMDCSDIYEQNFNQTDSDSPLTQAFVDVYVFRGKSCLYVIREILKAFNCKIIQFRGYWYIVRLNAMKAEYVRRRYRYSAETDMVIFNFHDHYNPLKQVDNVNNIMLDEPTMTLRPAWKKLTVNYNSGFNDNLLRKINFVKMGPASVKYTLDENGFFQWEKTSVQRILSYGLRWDVGFFEPGLFTFEFSYSPISIFTSMQHGVIITLTTTDTSVPADMRTVYLHGEGNEYNEPGNGFWQPQFGYAINGSQDSYKKNFKVKFRIYQGWGGLGGSLRIIVLRPWGVSTDVNYQGDGDEVSTPAFYLNEITLAVTRSDGKAIKDFEEVKTEINESNFYTPDKLELTLGDIIFEDNLPRWIYFNEDLREAHIRNNLSKIYDGILLRFVSGPNPFAPTRSWSVKGKNAYNRLVNVIADEIASNHLKPQRMISGCVYGDIRTFDTVQIDNKVYFILRGEHNVYDSEWNADFIELTEAEQDFMLLKTGGYVRLKTGGRLKKKM